MIEHTPIKQTLLNILKRNNKSSMKDIMLHFKISDIAIRKHLNELIQKGFIKVESVKQAVGRPYYIYELTSKGHETFPNQYESLQWNYYRT